MQFKYPTRENIKKVILGIPENKRHGIIYLKGDNNSYRHNTDVYLGIDLPGFSLIIELKSEKLLVFGPNIHEDEIMWIGPQQMKKSYDIDEIYYNEEFKNKIKILNPNLIHVFTKVNGIEELGEYKKFVEPSYLEKVIKTKHEIELLKEANRIARLNYLLMFSEAHVSLMKSAKQSKNERELFGLFSGTCYKLGSNGLSYIPIVGSGNNPSILHYNHNNMSIVKDSLVLVDAGCEFQYYGSDITRTYPVNGKYSEKQKQIYLLVLEMHLEVIKSIKPNVNWEDMHLLAMKIGTKGLLDLGLLKGSLDDLIKAHIIAAFFPHGLGHSIGLDVHDVGGYPPGVDKIDKPGLKYLRMRRMLKENMVVTVEPGIYFSSVILDYYRKDVKLSQFIDWPTVTEYLHVGGVRIEDSVVITSHGCESITAAPKSIEEIEKTMSEAA